MHNTHLHPSRPTLSQAFHRGVECGGNLEFLYPHSIFSNQHTVVLFYQCPVIFLVSAWFTSNYHMAAVVLSLLHGVDILLTIWTIGILGIQCHSGCL